MAMRWVHHGGGKKEAEKPKSRKAGKDVRHAKVQGTEANKYEM